MYVFFIKSWVILEVIFDVCLEYVILVVVILSEKEKMYINKVGL